MITTIGDYLFVVAILVAVLAVIWFGQSDSGGSILSRILARREYEQFRRDYRAGLTAGGKDALDALIEATREHAHESYAWGPDADDPIPYVEVTDFADWEDEYQRHRAEQEESER